MFQDPIDDPDEDQEGNQEIDFDKLLGDAVMSQAEYEEDREDQFEDDDDDAAGKTNKNFDQDSLAFSMSMPQGVGITKPQEAVPSKKIQQQNQQQEA